MAFPFSLLRRLTAVTLLAALALPAWAQERLSLPEARALALARSPQLRASDAAARSLAETALAAGQLPDPVLRLGIDNLPVSGSERFSLTQDFMTMRRIGLMQELPRGEKRQLRVERVGRDAQRVSAERALAAATIERETALAWIARWYAAATLDLLRLQDQESRLQVEAAEVAFRAGRGSPADIFAGRAALANLQDRLREGERQARSASLMLARWVGAEAAARPLAGAPGWREAGAFSPEHRRGHPQLAVLAAQVAAFETELRQAQAETRPDWTLEANYQQRGSAYSNMVSIGVSVPLQLGRANRQDRTVAARAASLVEAQARLDDALLAHEAEVQVARNDWQAGRERVDQLQATLLPAARQRSEAALASYRSGRADLAATLMARREEIDARLQVLALEMETARQWAGLAYLTTTYSEQP